MISKLIQSILDYYFRTDTLIFPNSEIEEIDILKDKGVVILHELTNYKIITRSSILLDYLYTLIHKHDNDFKTKLANVEQFFNTKREEIPSAQWNSFKELEDSYVTYLFYNLYNEKGVDTYNYFLRLPKDDKYTYEEQFYESLPYANLNVEELFRILSSLDGNEFHEMSKFCTKFAKCSYLKSISFYEHSLKQSEHPNSFYILSNLLIGFHHINKIEALNRAKDLLYLHPTAAISAIARFEYSEKEELQEVYSLASNTDSEIEGMPYQLAYLYKSLIENSQTPKDIRVSSFSRLEDLFIRGDDNIRNSIFNHCRFIKGFEEERYRFFVDVILSKSKNFYTQINDFFRHISNPEYFFELVPMLYLISIKNRKVPDVDLFSSSFSHFRRKDLEKTNQFTLDLISHEIPALRLAAVALLRSNHSLKRCYEIDLLNLNSAKKQLRAAEALFRSSFYNIKVVIPLIMSLTKSKYQEVIDYIQKKLMELVFESYHSHLLELIEQYVPNEKFFASIKKRLSDYHKMCKVKEKYNDINPYHNERDWMQLYRQLEQENLQKQVRDYSSSEQSFLSMIKETVIVRGHSWQIGDNEVSPLGNFQSSMAIDMRMFKDPDLFNNMFQEYNFISEF